MGWGGDRAAGWGRVLGQVCWRDPATLEAPRRRRVVAVVVAVAASEAWCWLNM